MVDVKHGSRAGEVLHGARAVILADTGLHRLACLIGKFCLMSKQPVHTEGPDIPNVKGKGRASLGKQCLEPPVCVLQNGSMQVVQFSVLVKFEIHAKDLARL